MGCTRAAGRRKSQIRKCEIRGLNGKIDYQSQSQTNDPLYRLSFKVDAADYRQDSLHLSGKAITGFSQSTTAALGTHLENLKVSLLSPQVTINQLAKFNVPTVELQLTKSGLVNIKGVSFLKELSQQMPAKLARFEGCSFGTGTKIGFCLDYCPQAAEIKSLSGKLNAQDFRLKNLCIDHIYSAFSWNQNSQEIRLHKASLKRGNEWIQIDGIADLARKDYCLAIKASAIPTDYNPIMPDWWHKIFRDIQFFEQPSCDANFEVWAASVKGLPIFTLARSMHKILPTVESPLTAVSYAYVVVSITAKSFS